MKTILLRATCTIHDCIRFFNLVCFGFLFYAFFADFGLWPKLHWHAPFFVTFPVGTFLFRLRFAKDEATCPITTFENSLKE